MAFASCPSDSNIIVIEVPTEAGTHWPGQAKAPQALRNAGLFPKLQRAGYNVTSLSALEQPQHWIPTNIVRGVRDEENTLKVMKRVSDAVASPEASNRLPIILGGDCSIEPGVLSGLNSQYPNERIGILYFDGDADLTMPTTAGSSGMTGILDSMVLTHLTQRPGALESMKEFSKPDGGPLVTNENIVLFGLDSEQPLPEHWSFLVEGGFKVFTRATISQNPNSRAVEALIWLESRVDRIVVHFDLDVIDSGKFPLGNFPHYAGLQFDEAMASLEVFVGSAKFAGLVITEVNPNNDPSGKMVEDLVNGVVLAFSKKMSNRS